MTKERVLSGMRSSGKPHLGNLLGALKNWVHMQETYECFYFIADWHALTTGYADTTQIRESVEKLPLTTSVLASTPRKVCCLSSRSYRSTLSCTCCYR